MPSLAIQVGPHWPGYNEIKHLVIFGASYCQTVGLSAHCVSENGERFLEIPPPTFEQPLGVEFPGETYDGKAPNWVGHLISPPQPNPKLVYNYARSGDMVAEVGYQIEKMFLRDVTRKRSGWTALHKDNTLYFTWIGINDVANASFNQSLKKLFEYQQKVYENGGRNFVFINHPPTHRVPSEYVRRNPKFMEMWNAALEEHAKEWALRYPDLTVMLYSSWDTFNRVLDEQDSSQSLNSFWMDDLHPTSEMHKIIAEDLEELLVSLPPTYKSSAQ
ncbi:hypothetical protein F5I97DRAFT_1805828 [Phlebopus sp. FC_14]|nr:hypothetical protein F5I97DRAFT_1805828 [Phlebopus sp. FC_14]